MGRPNEEKIQICPFSSGTSSSPGYANIHCYASDEVDGLTIKFRKLSARDYWYDDYCTSFCYTNCVFYQALAELNLENDK